MASLIIYLWIYNELSYDKFHTGYERIYRVLMLSKSGDEVVKSAACYTPIAQTLKMDYPQVEYATFIHYESEDSPLHLEDSGKKIEARMSVTDEDFFKIFNGFRFIEGSAENAFNKPENIVLSENVAIKLFGKSKALGNVIVCDKYKKEIFIVSGVIKVPQQSHFNLGYLVSNNNSQYSYYNSWHSKANVYIKLKEDANIDDQFLNSISNQVSHYSKFTDKLLFQPLADIHLYTDYETFNQDKDINSYKYVWIFSALAFLIVLMAIINFSILSVARASERVVEIGIKKANGASRFGIFKQFMTESVIQTSIASLLALAGSLIILKFFNFVSSRPLTFIISIDLIVKLLLLTLIVGIISGLYPSLVLSSFKPIEIFKKGSGNGSRRNFIRILITIQFAIAVFFIIAALLFVKQLYYIQNKDLGLDNKNVVVIPTGLWYDNKEFKEELLKNPNILSVSASVVPPVDFAWKYFLKLNYQGRSDSLETSLIWVDEDFAKTYRLEVVKGQFLKMDYADFWKEYDKKSKTHYKANEQILSIPIVINQTAEKRLGFADPIGKRIGDNVIVGVVKDFNFRPLRYPIQPVVLKNDPQNIMTLNIRIAATDIATSINYIRDIYKKYRDDREFSYNFFEDLLNEKYKSEKQIRNITLAFAFLAVIISVMGILGMSIFSIDRRTREIGIRKVAGSNSTEILSLLNLEFIKWVIVALVISNPLAWFAMNEWLQNFAYRTKLSWWIFFIADIIALLISLLIVTWQSWRIAVSNPIDSLRYD